MLYLPDEMYKQKNKTIPIIFGKPIPSSAFDNRLTDKVWADKVKSHVYKLESQGPLVPFNPEL